MTIFPDFERELLTLARRSSGDVPAKRATQARGRAIWKAAARAIPVVASIAVVIAVVALSGALKTPPRGADAHRSLPPHESPRPRWLLALSAQFAILDGPATKPTSAITQALEVSGVNRADLRFVHRIELPLGAVWVAPGSSQVCVAFVPAHVRDLMGVTCSTTAQAKRGGVRLSAGRREHPERPPGPQNPLRSWHAGIVPNRITKVRVQSNTGQVIIAHVRHNAFATTGG